MKITSIGNPPSPSQAHLDSMRADAERRHNLMEMQCAGSLRRLGIQPTGKKLNVYELDKILSEKRCWRSSIAGRIYPCRRATSFCCSALRQNIALREKGRASRPLRSNQRAQVPGTL